MMGKKIVLGTANFGVYYGKLKKKKLSVNEIKKIFLYCLRNEIDTLDTSTDYEGSENIIGLLDPKKFNIITKISNFDINIDNPQIFLEDKLKKSLTSLKTKKIYALLFRNPSSLTSNNNLRLWQIAKNLKSKGLIKKIGITIYEPKELDQAFNYLKPDLVQVPYNIFDRRIEQTGWLNKLYNSGVEIHCRSIFLQGLLLLESHNLPKIFSSYKSLWNSYDSWLKKNGVSRLEACTNFVFRKKEISKIVLGVENKEQLKKILAVQEKKINYSSNLFKISPKLIDPRKW